MRVGSDITGGGIIEPRNLPINVLNNGGLTTAFNADHTTTFSGNALVPDDAYDSSWNADLSVPTKNAIWDSLLPITGGTPSFAGTITSTKATSPIFTNSAASTGSKYWEQTNTGAQLYWGNESSTGGSLVSGSPAYSSFLSTGNATDLVLGTNLVKGAILTATGLDVVGNITAANLTSGTYTPTLTNDTNLSSSTAQITNYYRIGSMVHVSGYIDIDPVAATTTVLLMSLPISTSISVASTLNGVASGSVSGQYQPIRLLRGDNATSTAKFTWEAVSTDAGQINFEFTYQIIP